MDSYYDLQCTNASYPPVHTIAKCVRMKTIVSCAEGHPSLNIGFGSEMNDGLASLCNVQLPRCKAIMQAEVR